jgi:plastin-1
LTLKQHPEIILLKKPDEDDDIMQRLGYEEILVRWLNYHITKNGGDRKVTNLGKDLIDGYAYGHVLHNVSHNFDKTFWDKNQDARS